MGILSRRYLRMLSYLVLITIVFFSFRRFRSSTQSIGPLGSFDTKDLREEAWLNTNNFEQIHGSKKFIVNVGRKKCFHVGRLWQQCFTGHEMGSNMIKQRERKTINKDLKGSYGYSWFGFSEYLFYDTLRIDMLSSMNSDEQAKLLAVHSISNVETTNAYKLHDNVYIETMKLHENLKKSNSILGELNILFGEDCVDPRPAWHLDKSFRLSEGRFPSYISYKYLDLNEEEEYIKNLKIRTDGKFKITQLADLHLSVGEGECRDEFPPTESCEADRKTLTFVEVVLEIEKPDLVVFTGDQIMGDRCVQDSESALLKALAPVIDRKIPWTLIWGNHDQEGSLDRWKLSEFTANLPYSLFSISPRDTNDNSFGVGNHVIQIQDSTEADTLVTLYFFDSHTYSSAGKIYPGYDWIKEAQWEYMRDKYDQEYSKHISKDSHLSMAFFHIPIPEYLNFESTKYPSNKNAMVGNFKEGVTAPKYNSDGILTLAYLAVDVTSCGHDHCNDYCLLDDSSPRDIWLCFGGGSGEGGYGGYGGTERRIRIYEFDTTEKSIYTWKRLNGSPDQLFDYQTMISGGVPNAV